MPNCEECIHWNCSCSKPYTCLEPLCRNKNKFQPRQTPGETDNRHCVACQFFLWFADRREYACGVKGCWEGSKMIPFDPANFRKEK